MPRFDEAEFLERFRDDKAMPELWEHTFHSLNDDFIRYDIVNGEIIFEPLRNRFVSIQMLASSVSVIFKNVVKNTENLDFITSYNQMRAERNICDIKIDDDNIYMAQGAIIDKRSVKYQDDFIVNPIIVLEILHDDNKHVLDVKFENYKKLESLQEYVVFDRFKKQALVYRKSNQWQAEVFTVEEEFTLNAMDYVLTISVENVYWNVLARERRSF